jgi:uroporphyrin-III C-methyltransferase
MRGKVYLVGAGPGDPELLTVKAVRVLQSADAVLYDDLVAPEILRLIPARAQRHNVGKRCGKKKILQSDINFLMIALAESGLRVVRLKSGDPLIFGRAGEEIESLRTAGIAYDVVPGITSALGAAAAAHIPLTHRQKSSAVVFATAHHASDKKSPDWSALANSGATLVIYMPGQDYEATSTNLKKAGLANTTPCAIVSRATTSEQRIHRTTIAQLPQAPLLAAPTLLIVGEVARFADSVVEQHAAMPSDASSLPLAIASELPRTPSPDEEPIP